jgi:GNAT superfamily N-acetyltransferase
MRPLGGVEDYWRLRDLLRRAMLGNGRRELSWHVARLDYWWWFANPDLEHLAPEECVLLWETPAGELVAAINPEGPGQAFLQVDPVVASTELDEAMIAAAEARLVITDPDGRRRLTVFVDSLDEDRQRILAERGFRRALTAYLEPVATVAAHRRRGLARAVILEALQRLRRMGCRVAFVGGNSAEANALYASVMGPEHDVLEPWEKIA